MRTVANGLISAALIDTQKDATRTPYIDITVNGTNYWSRLEYLEYHEEAYRDRAVIGLNNRDRTLDSLDLDGKEFAIKLGYDTTGHGGSATDTVTYPTLWVKSHQVISDMGQNIYQIYAEGGWMYLREQKVVPGVMTWKASTNYVEGQVISPTTPNGHKYRCDASGLSGATEPAWPTISGGAVVDWLVYWIEDGATDPYASVFNKTHTVEGIIKLIIEGLGWTWNAVTNSDGLLDVFKPVFEINQMGFENAAALLYRLIWMTKSFIRQKAGKVWESVYPQDADAEDETYYSYQADWFTEYVEKTILLIPNNIIVVANQNPDTGDWYDAITGEASDPVQIAKYTTVTQQFMVGSIDNETDADGRAAAILSKFMSETLGGRMVANHDCRVELYDKIGIMDSRGK